MQELLGLLKKYGIDITPEFTGKFIRNGAQYFRGIKLASGEMWCCFGDWSRTGCRGSWCSQGVHEDALPEIQAILKEEDGEREAKYEEVAKDAERMWGEAKDTASYIPYFPKKKLSGLYGCRVWTNEHGYPVLLVPMRDIQGKLWNLTRIYDKQFEGGNKFLLPGGRKKGLFHLIGNASNNEPLYLCEGIGTGASILEALGQDNAVAVCFDAGNLPEVANQLWLENALLKFVICADDDVHKPDKGNAGREAGLRAQAACQGKLVFPKFKDLTQLGTDWNDLMCQEGIEVVREQLAQNNSNNFAADKEPEAEARAPKEEKLPTKERAPTKGALEKLTVERMLTELGPDFIRQGTDDFFKYNGTHWEHLDPATTPIFLRRKLDHSTQGRLEYKNIESAYKRLLLHIPQVPPGMNLFNPNPYKVAFKNGTLHLLPQDDGTFRLALRGHQKEDFLTAAHPFDYREEAPLSPDFEDAVAKVLGKGTDPGFEEALAAYHEVLGACLLPGAFRKIVLFVGPPNSGKSTLILFGVSMVHESMRCSVDPTLFEKFNLSSMAGKLLNFDTDMKLKKPLVDSVLKKVEDRIPMRIERKRYADIYAPIPGMHMLGANAMPMTEDGAGAYARRMLIFKCTHFQPQGKYIHDYAQKIWREQAPGIVVRAIQGLKRLCENKGHFTSPASS